MNKTILIKNIINYLDLRYPRELALEHELEKIGLSIGDENIALSKILLALDLTDEVLDEALNMKANFIITHHPFIYQAITKLLFNDAKTKLIKKMLNNNVSTFSMHTNLDVAKGGVNDSLAKILNLKNIQGEVLQGAFLRTGEITKTTLINYIKEIKKAFNLEGLKYLGDDFKEINKVGIIGGSGGDISNIDQAIKQNVDLLITGEIKLHAAQYAKTQNIALVEVYHGIEQLSLEAVKVDLESNLGLKDLVFVSKVNTDPLKYM